MKICRQRARAVVILVGVYFALLLTSHPVLQAQAITRPFPVVTSEPAVALSPFVVQEEKDVGYVATHTLAGSSLNTPLRDVSAQVSVMTSELLRDLGATNIEEAFLYSTNIETSLEYTDAQGSDNAGVSDLRNNNRIRGLGTASSLRGLFQTNIQPDVYNTERLTIASGANAILFGLANAGGSFDSTPQGAAFRNSRSLTLSTDDVGSRRASVNLNRVLLPGKLGLRLAGLVDDQRHFRKPAYDDQRRLYAALTYQPFNHTTVRANSEWIARDASRASLVVPRDWISLWLRGVDGREGTADDRPLFDNRVNANVPASNPLFPILGTLAQTTAPVYTYGGTGLPPGVYFYRTAVDPKPPSNAQVNNAFDRFPRSLDRPDIYDYRDVNTWGLVRRNDIHGYARQASIEQRVGRNLHLQLAYADERVDERNGGYTGSTNTIAAAEIKADPNLYINDNGRLTPNPNAGMLYIEQRPIGQLSRDDIEQLRFKAAYELDFASRPGWQRWLGRHQLGAQWSDVTKEEISQQFYRVIGGNPSWTRRADGTYEPLRHNYDPQRFRLRYYLDGSNRSAPNPFAGDVLETATFTDPGDGKQLPVYMFDAPNGGFRDAVFRRANTLTDQYSIHSRFWGERLVPFYGVVRTRVRNSDPFLKDNPTANPRGIDSTGFFPRYDRLAHGKYNFWAEGRRTNWGVVVRPLSGVSVRYNESENFKVNEDGSLGPFGEILPGGIGKSEDWGIRLEDRAGRYHFSLNFFTNSQLNNRTPSDIQVYVNNGLLQLEQAVIAANQSAGRPTPLVGVDLARNGTNLYKSVSDYVSKGLDAELVLRPSRQWRILLNVGQQKAIDTNLLHSWNEWAQLRLPVWQSVAGGWDRVIVPFGGRTVQEEYDLWMSRYGPLAASNGRRRDNQREWRVNTFANYTFAAGRLKGLEVGAGARWRSSNVIGYGLLAGSSTLVLDPNQPYRGPEELTVDAKLGYRLKLGRSVAALVQLNVKNALANDNLVPIRAATDGTPGLLSMQMPREFILSTTFEF
jgi:hypothetical protein